MTRAVDISREAIDKARGLICMMHAKLRFGAVECKILDIVEEKLLALRAALDAAERERYAAGWKEGRDAMLADADTLLDNAKATADATGYARGVRDAAGVASADERRFPNFSLQHAGEIMTARRIAAAILALLHAEKEPTP